MKRIYDCYRQIKSEYLATKVLSTVKLQRMHDSDKLAGYIEQVEYAYNRININDQKQALNILKVRFHNQNLIGALNEEVSTKEQKSNAGYNISCCVGHRINPDWPQVRGSATTVDHNIAEYVKDQYQVLEIDRIRDSVGILRIYAVLEHKHKYAQYAHEIFWSHYIEGRWPQARKMALGMQPVWNGQLSEYYRAMYKRMLWFKAPPKNWNGAITY